MGGLSLKDAYLNRETSGQPGGGLVSFAVNYFMLQKPLTDALVLALVIAISLFIGGFIGRSLAFRFLLK